MQVVENGFGTQVMYGEKRGEHKPFCGQESGLHSIIWAAAHSFLPTTSFFLFFLFFHQFCPFGHRGGKFWKSGFPLFSSLKKSNGSQNIPSISKTLKAYLGLHFHTIFDFVCFIPWMLMMRCLSAYWGFWVGNTGKGRHLSTFCPPVSHIDAYQFTLIELIGALCVQGVGK